MDAMIRESTFTPSVEPAIILGNRDLWRLRSIVERHAVGVDAVSAELLDAELDRAIVVPQAHVPANIVAVGSRVVIEDVKTDLRREVVLVAPEDADAAHGLISVLAPLGRALLGAAEGEEVLVERPHGETSDIRIRAVIQDLDAA